MNKTTPNKLLEKYCKNIDHAKQVEQYCLKIVEATQENLCELTQREMEYLSAAALLHDIGYAIDKKSHHKHTMKMILEEGLEGFDEEEKLIIANVARYHRSSLPDETKHENFAKLNEEQKSLVKKLASILRIADGMDNPHKNLILRIRLEQTPESFDFYIKTVGFKPKLETAKNKADLFEQTFKKSVNFLFE